MAGTKPLASKSNPNGANGTTSDPREQVMWDIYVTNLSKGIDNAAKAAKEAGYGEAAANNVTLRGWFMERKQKLFRKEMYTKAEKLLDRTLGYDPVDGEGKINVQLVAVQAKVATTIVSTQGKDDGYSTRSEITGADGKDLIPEISDEQYQRIIRTAAEKLGN